MGPVSEIQHQRIRQLLSKVIIPATHPHSASLAITAARLIGEPVPLEGVAALTFTPMAVGDGWGGMWSTTWLRAVGTVPSEFSGRHVVARIDLGYDGAPGFGGEALVYQRGLPFQGVDPRHHSVEVSRCARGGEEVDLLLEAAANPHVVEGPLEWPLLMPDYGGKTLYRLARLELAVEDDEMMAVAHDWQVLTELADALGHEHRRGALIVRVLDDVARLIDLNDLSGTLVARRGAWEPLLDAATSSTAHRVTAVGHAHIDSAWLWPIRETRRKCVRTFATALRLMEEYPDYVFVCSQAQQHAWVEEDHPEVFEEMRQRAASGQFEPVGSMWVEPDTNIPSGESLARQLVFGKRFFLDRYGSETLDCWLPDAFGYSGNLPQILKSAGVRRFLTQKLSWNEVNAFPSHTFWWEGIDGSRVLTHCPPTDTYNGDFTPGQLLSGERRFAEHAVSGRSLYAYGFGDGGGGPTREMLERAARLRDLDPLPAVSLGGCRRFFDDLERDIDEEEGRRAALAASSTAHAQGRGGLPVWVGELYLERHRGVQTTQAASKLGNRRSEALLYEAELWNAALVDGVNDDATRIIDGAWRTVLLHQFHDMLPGSAIHWVHADSRSAYAEVAGRLSTVIEKATGMIAGRTGGRGPIVVFNPATNGRWEPVEIDLANLGGEGCPSDGSEESPTSAVQPVGEGRALILAAVPGTGWARHDTRTTEREGSVGGKVTVDGLMMSNGLVSAELDEDGFLVSLRDLSSGREAIEGRGNVIQLHRDLPNDFDAWDIDQGSFEWAFDQEEVGSIEVVERGPLRAAIRVRRPIGSASELVQDVRLNLGSRRVEFVTEVEWNERHTLMKVAFPVAVRAAHATFEVPFGHVERATHANTSWDAARFEVPAQRWASIEEPGFGVALLNDCKYGYDVQANVLRLSLLRGPGWPDPTADAGRHRFSYAVLPHTGGSAMKDIVAEADAFNFPLRVVAEEADDPSRASSGRVVALEGATLSAVKRPDDNASELVVRLYESSGSHHTAILESPGSSGAERTDLLERRLGDLVVNEGRVVLSLRPFEIVTVRLRF